MSGQANRQVLESAVAAWNAGDEERYLQLYAPTIQHHGVGPEPLGPAENRGFYELLWSAFPGSQITIDDVITEGDKLSARFRLEGEHKGEFMGVPATGRPFMLAGQTIMRFAGGQVAERWTTSDMFGLMVQLGAVPPPPG